MNKRYRCIFHPQSATNPDPSNPDFVRCCQCGREAHEMSDMLAAQLSATLKHSVSGEQTREFVPECLCHPGRPCAICRNTWNRPKGK